MQDYNKLIKDMVKGNKPLPIIIKQLVLKYKSEDVIIKKQELRDQYILECTNLFRDATYSEYINDKFEFSEVNNLGKIEYVLKPNTLNIDEYELKEDKKQISIEDSMTFDEFLLDVELEFDSDDAYQKRAKKYLNEIGYYKKKISDDYNEEIEALTIDIPKREIETWVKQESEARLYLSDTNAKTPFIDALCEARNVPKDILVEKIIYKADIYAVAVATATGKRQKLEDEINNS